MSSNNYEEASTKLLLKRLGPKWCELRYDEIKNKPYLVGKRNSQDDMQAIFSLDAKENTSFQNLKDIITDSGQSNVLMAVHSDDSTYLFYKCQMGLKSPITPKAESSDSSEESSENEL